MTKKELLNALKHINDDTEIFLMKDERLFSVFGAAHAGASDGSDVVEIYVNFEEMILIKGEQK